MSARRSIPSGPAVAWWSLGLLTLFALVECLPLAPAHWFEDVARGTAFLVAWLSLMVALRLARLIVVQRRLHRIREIPLPDTLRQAVERTGSQRVRCVPTRTCAAFCIGVMRPSIVVSSGVLERLRPRELDAVLIHESDHARRREPLRRMLAGALAETLFFAPLVGWWKVCRLLHAELAADRAAIRGRDRDAVAGALLVIGSWSPSTECARYSDAQEIRVAILLGDDDLPAERPAFRTWMRTAAGCGAALITASCIQHPLATLLGA